MRIKTIAILAAFCGLTVAAWLFFSRPAATEWGVLVFGLPSSVSVKNASQNTSYYILKQTHEPVFRRDDGQKYRSRILKRWARNLDSSEYEFCPDTGLKFNDTESFTVQRFLSHIALVTGEYDPSASVNGLGDCVNVRFSHSRKGYLDFLTHYENAPEIKRTEDIWDGLGKYTAQTISKDAITLKRKEKTAGGYDTAVFYEYKGKKDPNLQNRKIKDFNLIPLYDVPEWVVRDYFSMNTVEMKSLNLIINHPDKKVRQAVYNCLDTAALRHSLFPQKKDFYDVQTILPIGITGAKGGEPIQQCDTLKYKWTPSLKFANWNEDASTPLTEYINSVNSKTGMNIRVVNFAPGELVKTIHSPPHPYNLVAIALEAIRPDYSMFFSYFFSEKGYYDFGVYGLRQKYMEMLKEEDTGKKGELAAELAQELADEALVLTLYQNVKTLYYPKEIKHLAVGKGFLQYPEVASLQI